MRGVSAESLAEVVRRLEEALGAEGVDPVALGGELFTVAGLLDAEPALRRAVTDPSTAGEARSGLLRSVLQGRVSDAAVEVSSVGAGARWSATRDLGDALEHAGVVAEVAAAERAGQADELDDELFRFGRVVAGDRGLHDTLTDRTTPTGARQSLVRSLLEGKASSPTVELAQQAAAGRHRSLQAAIDYFTDLAAQRRDRYVATVRSATPLSDADQARLAEVLRRQYGRDVHLNTVVDPGTVGGLRVEIGDEVIDGTVASKIDDARRRLAG